MTERRPQDEDLTGEVLAITDQLLDESRRLLEDLDTRLARGVGSGKPDS